jgi:hypothetical protein
MQLGNHVQIQLCLWLCLSLWLKISRNIGICAKLRYTVYLFLRLAYNFQLRISRHSLTSSCQIYPYFGSHVTGPDQGFPLGFLVSPPRPHTKALGTRLRKLFYVFNIWITRTTATRSARATRYPSPAPRHQLPVTSYPSPATRYPSPATRHPPPAENTCRVYTPPDLKR